MKSLRNQKGQGLIEYIIIVSLVAVGSMALLQVLQQSLNYQLGNISKALGAKSDQKIKTPEVTAAMNQKKDMTDFMKGIESNSKNEKP